MEIYIEYVIIDNLVINTLILLCTKATMKLKTKFSQIFLSAVIGTIFACVYPLLGLSNFALFPMKIALGIIMVLVLAPFMNFKEFALSFLFFILYTAVLGGACVMTLLMFGTSLESLSAGGYDIAVPVGVILLIVSLYVCIIISLAKYFTQRKNVAPFIREAKLEIAGKELVFNAFIDSGNKLVDKKTGLPIIILSVSLLEKYFCKEEIENLLLNFSSNKNSPFKNVHSVDYNTISGEQKKMVVFEADWLCIKNQTGEYKTNKFMVGLTYKKFNDAIKYDMLLNPAVL